MDVAVVQDFIAKFERRLKADDFPLSRHSDALVACCDSEEANWVAEDIEANAGVWGDIKKRFLEHFIDQDLVAFYRHELEVITMKKGEAAVTFMDRCRQAMKLANSRTDRDTQCVHFTNRLPKDVQRDLKVIKASNPAKVASIDAITDTLITLYPTKESKGVQQASSPSASSAKKSCDNH